MTKKLFYTILGFIWGAGIVSLFIDLVSNFIGNNLIWTLPILLATLLLSLLLFHITLPNKKDPLEINKKKLWSWLSGSLAIILIIIPLILLFIPSTSEMIQSLFFQNDETLIATQTPEEASETSSPPTEASSETSSPNPEKTTEIITTPATDLFLDGCIPESWKVFNINGTQRGGCWLFSPPIVEGTEDGFNIDYLGTTRKSFLIYKKLDEEVSKISFKFIIGNMKPGVAGWSTDLYFGFLPNDIADVYPQGPVSDDDVEFNGEFVLARGIETGETYGYICKGQNTNDEYDRNKDDINLKANHVYEVDIEIVGNNWNVLVENKTTGASEDVFFRNENDILDRIFAFGARITTDGVMNTRVFDFHVE
ncbi:MAG: hypothetical protein SVR94_17025 [Pseudomonadota bacterium]|nr:hypothetical protein [Pseudomonadota bacterium]